MNNASIDRPREITACFDELANRIKDHSQGERVLLVTNRGNFGDALIRDGAEEFLRHHAIPYHVLPRKDLDKKRTTFDLECAKIGHSDPMLLFLTAGAFSHHYDVIDQISGLARRVSRNFFLPATYEPGLNYSLLPETAIFYARDRGASLTAVPNAEFCHDMAFFLEPKGYREGRGVGYFFRTDRERNQKIKLPRSNIDISRRGKTENDSRRFLDMIAAVDTVYTDRLHVAIGGAILGRRVHLYLNDYFKIREIYLASLAPYFPNVTFHSPEEFEPQVETSIIRRIYGWLK